MNVRMGMAVAMVHVLVLTDIDIFDSVIFLVLRFVLMIRVAVDDGSNRLLDIFGVDDMLRCLF